VVAATPLSPIFFSFLFFLKKKLKFKSFLVFNFLISILVFLFLIIF
jgi:hypothetical protein